MAQQDPANGRDAQAINNELEQIQDKLRQLKRDLTARKAVHVNEHGPADEPPAAPADDD